MSDRLDNVEAKLAFLEDANDTLGREVEAQLRRIQALESQLARALDRVAELEAADGGESTDEPPPHY